MHLEHRVHQLPFNISIPVNLIVPNEHLSPVASIQNPVVIHKVKVRIGRIKSDPLLHSLFRLLGPQDHHVLQVDHVIDRTVVKLLPWDLLCAFGVNQPQGVHERDNCFESLCVHLRSDDLNRE